MALVTGVGLFLMSIVTAVFSRIAAAEFSSWNPWIVHRIIKIAVCRLPKELRERYEEEWKSHVDEVPGEIGRILAATSFLPAALKMADAASRDEFDHLFSLILPAEADNLFRRTHMVTELMDLGRSATDAHLLTERTEALFG